MKFALAAAALLVPSLAFAQSLGSTVPSLTITLTPANPQPGQSLTITPESTVFDLKSATVNVSVNGKKIASGNAAPVSITLPAAGNKTTISVTATLGSQSYSASVSLMPGGLALIEEPIASAPALYLGKPLTPDGGSVRVVAVPDFETSPGRQIAPDSLIYSWNQDGSTLESASGIGRQAVVINAPLPYRSTTLSLTASSQDGTIVGADSIAVSSQEPALRLYADDPLEGILFDTALGGNYAVGSESTLVAVPYSFALDQGAPQIAWFLNGASAQTGSTITLRPTGSGSGSASLSASATGQGTSATAAASLSLSFGAASAASFFGL